MAGSKTIVVGIDVSVSSSTLLRQAARMANGDGSNGTIIAVHVVDRSPLKQLLARGSKISEEEVLRVAGDRLATAIAESGVDAETVVKMGSPSKHLVDTAKDRLADLLLLSAHNDVGRRLGSIASRCVRHSKVPTLLLRDWHEGPFASVAACIDFSRLSSDVFRHALDAALRDGAPLELIYAIFPPGEDYYGQTQHQRMDDDTSYKQQVETHTEKRIDEFLEPFRDELKNVSGFGVTILETMRPGSAINDHLAECGDGLVVIGTTGRTQVTGLHFGSNAERLVRNAPCSVLAVK